MISIIVAMDKNHIIGNANKLPWHYPEDLKYFKNQTLNRTIAMGYKTFISIGKVLPKRKNIIFTRKNISIDGAIVVNDLEKFLIKNKDTEEEIFIIGGREIYEKSLEYASKFYITHINKEYVGDVKFPILNFRNLNIISEHKSGDLTFKIYERKI